jgi:hypothetical protein
MDTIFSEDQGAEEGFGTSSLPFFAQTSHHHADVSVSINNNITNSMHPITYPSSIVDDQNGKGHVDGHMDAMITNHAARANDKTNTIEDGNQNVGASTLNNIRSHLKLLRRSKTPSPNKTSFNTLSSANAPVVSFSTHQLNADGHFDSKLNLDSTASKTVSVHAVTSSPPQHRLLTVMRSTDSMQTDASSSTEQIDGDGHEDDSVSEPINISSSFRNFKINSESNNNSNNRNNSSDNDDSDTHRTTRISQPISSSHASHHSSRISMGSPIKARSDLVHPHHSHHSHHSHAGGAATSRPSSSFVASSSSCRSSMVLLL